MQNGAKEDATKNNVKLTIASGKQEGDDQGQITAIEDAIARGDKGILITPMSNGVNAAMTKARDAGLYVIALDTPPDPADTVDITFATDNREAGKLVGQWAAAHARRQAGDHRPARPVRRQDRVGGLQPRPGLPRGDGHRRRRPEEERRRSEDRQVHRWQGGHYTIVCNEAGQGAEDGGRTAMERCLSQEPRHQPRVHDQRADGCRGERQPEGRRQDGHHRLRGRWMRRRRERQERHYRRDRPAVSAQDGDSRHGGHCQDRPRW